MPFTAHLHLSASGLFSGLSWQKWLGAARALCLWAFMVIGAGMLAGCKHSEQPAAQPHMQPRAPIKLPIPLDKAGYKVDTTFWVIPSKKYETWPFFVGLNIPFTAGDGTRIELMDAHPVKARVTLHRMEEGGAETKVVLEAPVKISKPGEPSKYEWIALPDDEAKSQGTRSYGTNDKTKIDGATYELEFAFPNTAPLAQGQYRLQVELLEDKPALKDMPAYLVVDYVGYAK